MQAEVRNSERIFTELIRSIERSRSRVTQLIESREKAVVRTANKLMEKMKKEIDDLKRQDAEIEQLSHTEHHILFLQVVEQDSDIDSGWLIAGLLSYFIVLFFFVYRISGILYFPPNLQNLSRLPSRLASNMMMLENLSLCYKRKLRISANRR